MSRKEKKRKRARGHGNDSHHLLWTRHNWERNCRLLLRRSFVYEIPIPTHRQLHKEVEPIPPLSDMEARELWIRLKAVNHNIGIFEALEWLIANAPNDDFAEAMLAQQQFLLNNLERS